MRIAIGKSAFRHRGHLRAGVEEAGFSEMKRAKRRRSMALVRCRTRFGKGGGWLNFQIVFALGTVRSLGMISRRRVFSLKLEPNLNFEGFY